MFLAKGPRTASIQEGLDCLRLNLCRFKINKWTPPGNSGGISRVSTRFSLSMEMSRLVRDGTAEPVSRDQLLRRERGQGNIYFPSSAYHVQDWQPYPVDLHSCHMCDHICIHNWCLKKIRTRLDLLRCLQKNQSTPRPSEHPPFMGEKMSKRCRTKTPLVSEEKMYGASATTCL